MQADLIWVPAIAGTARHAPSRLPRYSQAGVMAPYFFCSRPTTSSTGSSSRACEDGSQVGRAMMSCPLRDCASDAMVSRIWLPAETSRSIFTSTRFFAPHSSQSSRMMSLPAGTQWSQKPQRSTPAEPWACTIGAASVPVAMTPPRSEARAPAKRLLPSFPSPVAGVARQTRLGLCRPCRARWPARQAVTTGR